MRLILPLPPNRNRGNRSGGWAWASAKKKWYAAADLVSCGKGFPKPPKVPLTKVRVSAVLVMPNWMDADNAFYRASKAPMDWLKSRGYIENDSPKHIVWAALPEQLVSRREEPRLELTIEELAA